MTRLDKAANEAIRLAKKMAAEKIKKEKSGPKMWNGKRIIPLSEWKKKQNFNTHEWRDYYPDKYAPYLLSDSGGDEQIKEYQDAWWKEFSKYMESVKDPEFGKLKCQNCILNPVALPKITTVRDAIVQTNHSTNGKPLEFPCKIVNMFKCPYEDMRDQGNLVFLGITWKILDYALKYNKRLAEHKFNTYTVDFEKKEIFFILNNYDIPKSRDVDHFFGELKFPKFTILDHRDLYDVITTRDKLKSVLEEYLDALSSGAENNWLQSDIEHVRKDLDDFLDILDEVKDTITLESLKNIDGKTLRDIEEANEKYEIFLAGREKMRTSPEYRMPKPELSGTCFSCGEFADILCKNCNIWTCIEHWRDHGVQSHNYTRPENSSSSNV